MEQQQQRTMTVVPSSSMLDLRDELLRNCLVGPGHFRYVAGTCRHFKRIYCTNSKDKNSNKVDKEQPPPIGANKKTTWKAATASIACAKLGLKDEEKRDIKTPFLVFRGKSKPRRPIPMDWFVHRHQRVIFCKYVDKIALQAIKEGNVEATNMDGPATST